MKDLACGETWIHQWERNAEKWNCRAMTRVHYNLRLSKHSLQIFDRAQVHHLTQYWVHLGYCQLFESNQMYKWILRQHLEYPLTFLRHQYSKSSMFCPSIRHISDLIIAQFFLSNRIRLVNQAPPTLEVIFANNQWVPWCQSNQLHRKPSCCACNTVHR